MAEELNIHWVDDDELLDQFLREEIDPADRERLEAHLEECSACRVRLRQERAIVTGVRSFARKELKADLKSRRVSRTMRRNSAYRWLGAAATIVLAVAVWYVPGEETTVPVLDETPTKEKSAIEDGRPEEEKIGESVLQPEVDATGRDGESPAPVLRSQSRPEITDATAGAAMADDTDDILEDEGEGIAAAASVQPLQVSWSMAVEILEQPSAAAPLRQEVAAEQMKAQAVEKKADRRRDENVQQRRNVIVTQQPFSAAAMQVQQIASARRASIPVRFDESGDSLVLTLYPATPWREADMRSAQVIEISTDSLQILIGSRDLRISRSAVLQTQE